MTVTSIRTMIKLLDERDDYANEHANDLYKSLGSNWAYKVERTKEFKVGRVFISEGIKYRVLYMGFNQVHALRLGFTKKRRWFSGKRLPRFVNFALTSNMDKLLRFVDEGGK